MRAAVQKDGSTAAESYRRAMPVTRKRHYRDTSYSICPRCNITMEREFMTYCSRCGQCLDWKYYKRTAVIVDDA